MAKKKNGWGKKQRAVIIRGVRTPFVKAFGKFLKVDSIDLADVAVKALLDRTEIPHEDIDSIVWGGVIFPSLAPNIVIKVTMITTVPSPMSRSKTTVVTASVLCLVWSEAK